MTDGIGTFVKDELLESLKEMTCIVALYRHRVMTGEITGNLIKNDCEPYLRAEKLIRPYGGNPDIGQDIKRAQQMKTRRKGKRL